MREGLDVAAGRELCLGPWLLCQRHWVLSLSAAFPGQVSLPGPWLQAESPDVVSVLRGAHPAHLPEEPHSLHLPVRGLHPRGLRTLFCIPVPFMLHWHRDVFLAFSVCILSPIAARGRGSEQKRALTARRNPQHSRLCHPARKES